MAKVISSPAIEIGLTAAIVAASEETPSILVVPSLSADEPPDGLPSGPFAPHLHRTFEIALRDFVKEQTALSVGYVEQLYTFGDRGRTVKAGESGMHVVSVGYLALTRQLEGGKSVARFKPWYQFFPWEDRRSGRPPMLDQVIIPLLRDWARPKPGDAPDVAAARQLRLRHSFGLDGSPWDEEQVLERYELLYEAGLVEEARRDGRAAALARSERLDLGVPMRLDHRRILATAMARLRAKLKYRPVVFELMPPDFTLTALQRTVEAITGAHLHKQNFRRLVEQGQLVEPTGRASATGGRPAALFRFRREVIQERSSAGLRLGTRG